ncbi:MAG: sulfur oxidation c-type cytochrome SoxX [Rubrivivax sp.]|nr:sulfur oxidation c-type cytochrome SoxX [Rubrivivax sp.]
MNQLILRGSLLAAAALALGGCATEAAAPAVDLDKLAAQMIASSFRDQGIATTARLKQDLANAACSSEKAPDDATAERIMAEARATVKWPAGGVYLGDWREGERIAQSGRGMTWTDTSAAASANGGNCYNCHQISKQEISYGTIGPSLWNYGKTRGITGLDSPTAQPIFEYTWMKLWNARSYNACTTMPRFGHAGLMNETQLRHLMALLLDPKSPVNQ